MKIYVASSWRNPLQPSVVEELRLRGHEVYDFRNPPDKTGFSWRQADPDWTGGHVTAKQQRAMTSTNVALAGYASDKGALDDCEACVYVLPCGRSASWEFGYAMGLGKSCFVLWIGEHEPELMFREATVCSDLAELCRAVDVRKVRGLGPDDFGVNTKVPVLR